jgi:multidrug efflux pump subunit AcrB
MAIQLPDGASVARTGETVKQVEKLLLAMPQVQSTFAVVGFSLLDGVNEANNAFMAARLKPFADRKSAADSAQALITKDNVSTFAVKGDDLRKVLLAQPAE